MRVASITIGADELDQTIIESEESQLAAIMAHVGAAHAIGELVRKPSQRRNLPQRALLPGSWRRVIDDRSRIVRPARKQMVHGIVGDLQWNPAAQQSHPKLALAAIVRDKCDRFSI